MTPAVADKDTADKLRDHARSGAAKRTAFQNEYHDAIREVLPALLMDYITDLRTTEDPEVRRKGIAYFGQVIGIDAEKKQDAGSTRAVVTINFGGAANQQVTITQDIVRDVMDVQAKQVEDDEEAEATFNLPTPSALMRSNLHVNDEVRSDDS